MNANPNAHGFFDGSFSRLESRFEKVDTGTFAERSVQAQFGRSLRKLYPLPPVHSEPNEVHILLQKIQAKLEENF
jgi:hypothetical protein